MSDSHNIKHDPYAALKSLDYRRFAIGFLISSTGLQMLTTAVGWEIYERTNSAAALGYVGLVRALPVILLALPAGHLIDAFDRKVVLGLTQLAFGVCVGAMAVASYVAAPVWILYVLLGLSGCARVFNGPSRATLLPQIVAPEDFHNATTWNSGVFQLAATTGPLLAGWLIYVYKAAWPVYCVTAVACAIFGFIAFSLSPRPVRRVVSVMSWRGITDGISHLWREKSILAAITLDLFAVLLGGAMALLPVYAKDILQTGPVGLGILRSSVYVGAFGMALYMAHRPRLRHAGRALLWSIAAFGVSTIIFGFSTNFYLSLVCLAIGGAVDNVSVVIRHVLVQVRTPEELRGRVSSVNSVFIECSNELGAFESGIVSHYFGPVFSVVSGGIGTLIVVGLVAVCIPQILKLERLELDKQEPEEQAPEEQALNDPESSGQSGTIDPAGKASVR